MDISTSGDRPLLLRQDYNSYLALLRRILYRVFSATFTVCMRPVSFLLVILHGISRNIRIRRVPVPAGRFVINTACVSPLFEHRMISLISSDHNQTPLTSSYISSIHCHWWGSVASASLGISHLPFFQSSARHFHIDARTLAFLNLSANTLPQ